VITNDTRIVVFSPTTEPSVGWQGSGAWTANRLTRAALIAATDVLRSAYRITVVTGGRHANPREVQPNVAEVVFISTAAGVDTHVVAETADFAIVTHVASAGNNFVGTAVITGVGTREITTLGNEIRIGDLVRVTGNRAQFIVPGETEGRWIAEVMDTRARDYVRPGTFGVSSYPHKLVTNTTGPVDPWERGNDVEPNLATAPGFLSVNLASPTNLDGTPILNRPNFNVVASVGGVNLTRTAGRVETYANQGGNVFMRVNGIDFSFGASNVAQVTATGGEMRNFGTGGAPGTAYVNSLNRVGGAMNNAGNAWRDNVSGYYRGPANAIVYFDPANPGVAVAVILVRQYGFR
jgi:hypothetical protein